MGRKGKGGRGEEVEGGWRHTQKFWLGAQLCIAMINIIVLLRLSRKFYALFALSISV